LRSTGQRRGGQSFSPWPDARHDDAD
jgi:hypothetical protein